jgi:outer membrane protein
MGAIPNRFRHDPVRAPLLLAAFLAGVVPMSARAADEACTGPSSECVAEGRWNFSVALGAGARTNPLIGGENIPLVLVPHVSYYGKRFFLDDLDLGVVLVESESNTLSLVASPGYDRVYFYRTDLQNFFMTGFDAAGRPSYAYGAGPGTLDAAGSSTKITPRPRRITYLAGPEWTFKYDEITTQLDALHEITGEDHGNEIRAAVGLPIWKSKSTLSANIGLTWKDGANVNYYYGEPGIYRAGAALNPFAKLAYTRPLSSKWRFDAFTEYERLGSAIASSPIVDRHGVTTFFVGAVYAF